MINVYQKLKYIFAGFLLLCIVAMVISLSLEHCNKPKEEAEPSRKIEKIKSKPPTTYRDTGGTIHTVKEVSKAEIATIKASYQRIIDSLTGVLRIKEKQIADINQVGTTTTGTFKPDIEVVYVGADEVYEVSFKDRWFEMKGTVGKEEKWKYSVKDSITLVTYWKKTGFLKLGRKLVLDGFSQNPNTKIDGLTAIKIDKARPKKWGIGVNVIDGKQWKPYVGVGLTKTLIRF
jgi:hypothetical protein